MSAEYSDGRWPPAGTSSCEFPGTGWNNFFHRANFLALGVLPKLEDDQHEYRAHGRQDDRDFEDADEVFRLGDEFSQRNHHNEDDQGRGYRPPLYAFGE